MITEKPVTISLRLPVITVSTTCTPSAGGTKPPPLPFEDMSSPESEDVLQQLIRKEQIHRLADEINKLDDIYKSVMELKYINGFQNQEIADILKITKKTVEMRLYRAKKILKEKLKS